MAKAKAISKPQPIHSKVRGVSHKNDDGSSRQSAVRQCRPGQTLLLVRDKKNKHDSNAVKVCVEGKLFRRQRQLGFLSADLAGEIADDLDAGRKFDVVVSGVTGGGGMLWWKQSYGLNITITPR